MKYSVLELWNKTRARVHSWFGRRVPAWTHWPVRKMGNGSETLLVFFHGRNGGVPHTHHDIPRIIEAVCDTRLGAWSVYAPIFADYNVLGESAMAPPDAKNNCLNHLETKGNRVVVVGISYGGCVAQSLLEELSEFKDRIALVTFGSPHHGTELVRLNEWVAKRVCGESMYKRLYPNHTGYTCTHPHLTIASDADFTVYPPALCDIGREPYNESPSHIILSGVPHSSIPTHPDSLRATRVFIHAFIRQNGVEMMFE